MFLGNKEPLGHLACRASEVTLGRLVCLVPRVLLEFLALGPPE